MKKTHRKIPVPVLKKRLWHKRFPLNFKKTIFLKNISVGSFYSCENLNVNISQGSECAPARVYLRIAALRSFWKTNKNSCHEVLKKTSWQAKIFQKWENKEEENVRDVLVLFNDLFYSKQCHSIRTNFHCVIKEFFKPFNFV